MMTEIVESKFQVFPYPQRSQKEYYRKLRESEGALPELAEAIHSETMDISEVDHTT